MPRWRPISLGGDPGVGGKWDARADAPAKDPLRLEARSSGPEDLRVAVFHGGAGYRSCAGIDDQADDATDDRGDYGGEAIFYGG